MSLTREYNTATDNAAYLQWQREQYVNLLGMEEKPTEGNAYIQTGAGADRQSAVLMKESKEREADRTETHLLLEAMKNRLAALDQEIQDYEDGFEAKYGDAWREIMANQILDPDEIPEREAGESMAEYRERLEKPLIKEMLDENGEIKEKYKRDPEKKEWAQWAKAQHDKSVIQRSYDVLSDPTQPREAVEAELENVERYDFNRANQFEQTTAVVDVQAEPVKEAAEIASEKTDTLVAESKVESVGMDAFLNAGM